MSQEENFGFALKAKRRERIRRRRITAKTQEFYVRYSNQYEDMCQQGFLDYIPDEMEQFEEDLESIEESLYHNPERARAISREVGSYIHSLWMLGKEAGNDFRESARLARAEAKREKAAAQNAAITHYYDVVGRLDSIVANFAGSSLETIKNDILSGRVATPQEADAALSKVIEKAKTEANEWKEKTREKHAKSAVIEQIEEVRTSVQEEKFEDDKKSAELLAKLDEIKERVEKGELGIREAAVESHRVEEKAQETLVDEEARCEMVKAIVEWFRKHGFTVSQPMLVDGVVCITAKTPSGKRGQFKVMPDKMYYRLDGYEGQSCLKDIAEAKEQWESVYGFRLSDEVVTWQNPDRILRRQGQTESDIGGNY